MTEHHRCSICKVHKPGEEMTKSSQRPGGIGSWCKPCKNARRIKRPPTPAEIERRKVYYRANKAAFERRRQARRSRMSAEGLYAEYRTQHLRRTYGITVEEYDRLLAAQVGVCAVCGSPEIDVDPRTGRTRLLAVDHDHTTGAVRGLLCRRCNTALGLLGDEGERVKQLLRYLGGDQPWLRRESYV